MGLSENRLPEIWWIIPDHPCPHWNVLFGGFNSLSTATSQAPHRLTSTGRKPRPGMQRLSGDIWWLKIFIDVQSTSMKPSPQLLFKMFTPSLPFFIADSRMFGDVLNIFELKSLRPCRRIWFLSSVTPKHRIIFAMRCQEGRNLFEKLTASASIQDIKNLDVTPTCCDAHRAAPKLLGFPSVGACFHQVPWCWTWVHGSMGPIYIEITSQYCIVEIIETWDIHRSSSNTKQMRLNTHFLSSPEQTQGNLAHHNWILPGE
jgi:hypothetical protein